MQDDDSEIEQILLRYRPAAPPPMLRQRVLDAATAPTTFRLPYAWVFRAGVAAVLLLAFGLNHAAQQMNRATATEVGVGPVVWTADAEDAAQLIGGNSGREYVALALVAGAARTAQEDRQLIPFGAIR